MFGGRLLSEGFGRFCLGKMGGGNLKTSAFIEKTKIWVVGGSWMVEKTRRKG